ESFCDISFAAQPKNETVQISQLNPRVMSVQVGTQPGEHSSAGTRIAMKRLQDLPSERLQQLLTDFNPWGEQDWFYYTATLDSISETNVLGPLAGSPIVGCYNQHFVPSGVFVRVNRADYFTELYSDLSATYPGQSPGMFDAIDAGLLK